MSQGGNNEVARLNVAITGDVAPLAAAAKQAEQIVQQTAAKIEANTNAAAASGQSYMPGENFGPMYNQAASAEVAATKSKARGFKELVKPMREVLGAYSQLIGIGSLIGGMAATVVWAFNYKAQTARKLKGDIDDLRDSTKAAFDQFTEVDAPVSALDKYERKLEAIDKLEKEKIKQAKALRDGTGPGARLASAGITAAENAAFDARVEAEKQFTKDKNDEEVDREILAMRIAEKGAQEREDLLAKLAGGQTEVFMKSADEIERIDTKITGDALEARIASIKYEANEKIRLMEEAAKKIAADEIEQAKRVDAEKRRLMKDFYRDARAAQAEGTMVESFFAGNQGQSFGLANRQRGAIEGQLPSINYQGAE